MLKRQWTGKVIRADLLGLGLTRTEGLLSSGREADWAIVRMLLLHRAGERILLMLPFRRGGEADRAGDSMLVMSLSCSGFCSPPSGGWRRAVVNTPRELPKDHVMLTELWKTFAVVTPNIYNKLSICSNIIIIYLYNKSYILNVCLLSA